MLIASAPFLSLLFISEYGTIILWHNRIIIHVTVVGDFHAMVSLGDGCSFGDGSVVTCKEATPGVAKKATLDDNYVKVFVGCEGVTVETESAIGVVTGNSDFVFNGTTYSKPNIAPDADFLGIFSLYENDSMTYAKLALGEDDSVEFLD